VLFMALLVPVQAAAVDTGPLIRSLLLPGTGQAEQGNYRKAAIFAGSTIFFATGWFVAQIHYNQAVNRFRDEKREYLSYPERLASGEVINGLVIESTFIDMTNAFSSADSREVWRDFFLAGLLVTYTLNIVDVLVSDRHDPDLARSINVETTPQSIMLTKTIRF
jgi:hypothetical protein